MDLEILRAAAAAITIIAAAMVAANINARVTVWGFAIFIAASIAWIADGVLEAKTSLVVQNAVLLLINVLGYGAGCRAPARKPAPPKTEAQSVRPVSCQR